MGEAVPESWEEKPGEEGPEEGAEAHQHHEGVEESEGAPDVGAEVVSDEGEHGGWRRVRGLEGRGGWLGDGAGSEGGEEGVHVGESPVA